MLVRPILCTAQVLKLFHLEEPPSTSSGSQGTLPSLGIDAVKQLKKPADLFGNHDMHTRQCPARCYALPDGLDLLK